MTARSERNGATLWLGPLYDGPLTLTVEVDKGVTAFLLSLMRSFNLLWKINSEGELDSLVEPLLRDSAEFSRSFFSRELGPWQGGMS